MLHGLSNKIGIIGFILILIIALSTVMVNAQSPGASPSASAAATATTTVTATAIPGANSPVITAFNTSISKSKNNATPANQADVKVSVDLKNFKLSTATPTPASGGTLQGVIKYSMDLMVAAPMPSATAGMNPSSVPSPTATANPAQTTTVTTTTPSPFPAGQSILSTDTSFTFFNVPLGVHTFMVELVNHDGSMLNPRIFGSLTIEVIPPP